MGALSRATLIEVEELASGDPLWWPGLCGEIAENGAEALKAEKESRGWAWGALWRWVVGSEVRYREYTSALEAYVQMKALETVGIADGADAETASAAKLRIDTRFRVAEKVDRARWGGKVEAAGAVVVIDAGLVGFAGALLERVRTERVLNSVPVAAMATDEEI